MSEDLPALERPIILLGAARSGTKILRSILGSHPRLSVVPYDINYVWTMGNFGLGHDEQEPSDLKPEIRDFIRNFIEKYFNLLSILFMILLIGGFLLIKYVL